MPAVNFTNNFATTQAAGSAGLSSGATSSTLTSTTGLTAPCYLAFDATNINGAYELVLVLTVPGGGVVTHAALTNNHTVAEEVRQVLPAVHLNTMQEFPEGTLINGKIVPSVASNNLTVALKTKAGTDPSATDPVYVMIGGVMRSITSALGTATYNAGTNYGNCGSAELATKEVDWFAYMGWNTANARVVFNISRIPFATVIGDFSAGDTSEKCALVSSNWAGVVSTDTVVNIGRFAATLSAGANYYWSVPTFTASNLIQRPIYETRSLVCNGTVNGSGGSIGTFAQTQTICKYKIIGSRLSFNYQCDITNKGSWSGDLQIGAPFSPSLVDFQSLYGFVCAQNGATAYWNSNAYGPALIYQTVFTFQKGIGTSLVQWSDLTATARMVINSSYEI